MDHKPRFVAGRTTMRIVIEQNKCNAGEGNRFCRWLPLCPGRESLDK
jgi:hypothetical protein